MVTRRGFLGCAAALTGASALLGGGVAASTGVAEAAEARNVPFGSVPPPHLVQAEHMVQYQRMLAEGQLTSGLAGHWLLTGTTEDRSGNGRALTRGSATATGWSDLRVGQELSLDGTADAAYAATASVLDTTAPFTVSTWVRPAELGTIITAVSQDGAQTSRFLLMYDTAVNAWVDCTASPHGVFGLSTYWDCPDTRMVDNLDKAVSQNHQGAGIGHMVFYAKADGSLAGHRWSVNSAEFRAVAETTGTGPDATTSSGDSITAARPVRSRWEERAPKNRTTAPGARC
ncbi:hypothetical protein ACIA8O_26430 [Kitasatospora sp. NPDC051853]|uniref:hypothetical protein n=1 Tax=Kitasatospora sp. NPDC051853 TaxID=3364058 RepID=UPI0037A439C9